METTMRVSCSLLVSCVCLSLGPVDVRSQETDPRQFIGGEVVVVSDKVGEVIDRQERDGYRLFPGFQDYRSAVILLLPDSSFVARVLEVSDGEIRVHSVPINAETLEELREAIDGAAPAGSAEQTVPPATRALRTKAAMLEIARAKREAAELAKEKWTKERWREEMANDRGRSYRTAGGQAGFLLGAAAGMLIGKGLQGKKVVRTVYHEGGWFSSGPWTEEFYSYDRKYAPHVGAVIGGAAGALIGYRLGKKADKRYYILVPRDIRMRKTSSSKLVNTAVGLGLIGTASGLVCGLTLPTPASGRAGETEIGPEFIPGYVVGAILGTSLVAAYKGRAKRVKAWEESIVAEPARSSFRFQVFPSDLSSFAVRSRRLPSGEVFSEYRADVVRVSF